MQGTPSRSIPLALATAMVVAAIGTSTATTVAQSEPSASPEIHGWAGLDPDDAPAGLYSWRVGTKGWMHKVPADWDSQQPNSVVLTMQPVEADVNSAGTYTTDVSPASWAADPPYLEHPVKVVEDRSQTWLLDVGDTRVMIGIHWFPDTDPALVAEAVSVVESIIVQPIDYGKGWRLVFELQEGWDSG